MPTEDTLYVNWTMDCEPIEGFTPTGGPKDWELSARAMGGYVRALSDRGHRVTLFLMPKTAEVQAGLLEILRDEGAEIGMHCHPQSRDLGYGGHLGELCADAQYDVLRTSRDRIANAVGEAPVAFRPGCFSGTDATYPALCKLGFTHGSVSLPGRQLPEVAAMWGRAVPFAHWASAESRLASGDLPFLEMPTAIDLDDLIPADDEARDARHLRLERPGILDWGPDIIRRHLQRQIDEDWWLKTLVVMTHNTREYDDPDNEFRRNLEGIADAIEQAAAELGLTLVHGTLAEIHQIATRA